MSRKRSLSIAALVSTVAGLMWIAPQVSAQVFVGTPIPPQFVGPGPALDRVTANGQPTAPT